MFTYMVTVTGYETEESMQEKVLVFFLEAASEDKVLSKASQLNSVRFMDQVTDIRSEKM